MAAKAATSSSALPGSPATATSAPSSGTRPASRAERLSASTQASTQHLPASPPSIVDHRRDPGRLRAATEALDGYRLNDAAHSSTPIVWGHLLRLVRRAGRPARGRGRGAAPRDPGHRRLVHGPAPPAPPPDGALRHRGALGRLFEAPDGLLITSVWPELSTDLIDPGRPRPSPLLAHPHHRRDP